MNPIKELREKHNITQRRLAEQAEVSTLSVLRYEQGLYELPSEKIVAALKAITGEELTVKKYQDWVQLHRVNNGKYFKPLPNLAVNLTEHPFTTFRKTITNSAVGKDSRMAFCILLAVHPSVVADYEKGKQKHMPRLISHALSDAAVPSHFINSLDQLGVIFYERN